MAQKKKKQKKKKKKKALPQNYKPKRRTSFSQGVFIVIGIFVILSFIIGFLVPSGGY